MLTPLEQWYLSHALAVWIAAYMMVGIGLGLAVSYRYSEWAFAQQEAERLRRAKEPTHDREADLLGKSNDSKPPATPSKNSYEDLIVGLMAACTVFWPAVLIGLAFHRIGRKFQ